MANTPHRVIRVKDELWNAYGQVCASEGTTRAEDLRGYMEARVDGSAESRPAASAGDAED